MLGRHLTISAFIAIMTGCADIEYSCEPTNTVTPICGIERPEDLTLWKEQDALLVSEYIHSLSPPDRDAKGGAIGWLDNNHHYQRLIDSEKIALLPESETWGDENCSRPQKISPHGIHLSTRGDAKQLLTVNHGQKEKVLFFELQSDTTPGAAPAVIWRGCVEFPDNARLNDVAALNNGGFVVTHMFDSQGGVWGAMSSFIGLSDGHVWHWQPNQSLRILENSYGGLPNGIQVSADNRTLWINYYVDGILRKYDLETKTAVDSVAVELPDNIAWSPDGRLLVASHGAQGNILKSINELYSCLDLFEGTCSSPFNVIAVEPSSMDTEIVYEHKGGGPFGTATVAVPWQGSLYAGSAIGDRIGVLVTTKN